MAGSVFCGRICAHAFFFGSEEDVEEEERVGTDPEDE
jgi:hypothetical protein